MGWGGGAEVTLERLWLPLKAAKVCERFAMCVQNRDAGSGGSESENEHGRREKDLGTEDGMGGRNTGALGHRGRKTGALREKDWGTGAPREKDWGTEALREKDWGTEQYGHLPIALLKIPIDHARLPF